MKDKSNGKGCISCAVKVGKNCYGCTHQKDISKESRAIVARKED